MSKTRNALFVALVAACLLSAVGYKVAVKVGLAEDVERSVLEGRTYETFPELSLASFMEGSFQDSLEQYVADSVPERDIVLLANASLQRALISIANLPFGYDAYSTYFGSDYVCVPSMDAVWAKPDSKSAITVDELGDWAEGINGLIDENEDIDWVFYLCDRSDYSLANPAVQLSENVVDYEYLAENFLSFLSSSCTVVNGSYSDIATFATVRYLTDHHWTIQGAIDAYQSISEALGNETIEFGDVYEAYSGPFWGSCARTGLCTIGAGDVVYDVEYERSALSVTANGIERDEEFLDEGYAEDFTEYEKSSTFENVYSSYFHGDYGLVEIENLEVQNGEALLIVGDSFTDCMERFFAESYQYVYVIDPRHYEDGTLQGFLDEHEVDAAVFITSIQNTDDILGIL